MDEMKKLLALCTESVRFLVKNEIYVQNDGVAIGCPPLRAVLASVFMVKRESTLVPRLYQHVKKWRHYVDHTYAYLRNKSIYFVFAIINSFYSNISLTYEKENNYHF